jgi:hypothetical protein
MSLPLERIRKKRRKEQDNEEGVQASRQEVSAG